MRLLPGRQLVGLPVHAGVKPVGTVRDLVLGADLSVALGLVVELHGERRAFLPWVALSVEKDVIAAQSPRTLLGEIELAYYLKCGVCLSRLTGLLVTDDSAETCVGDVLVEPRTGRVTSLVVTDALGTQRMDGGQQGASSSFRSRLSRGNSRLTSH